MAPNMRPEQQAGLERRCIGATLTLNDSSEAFDKMAAAGLEPASFADPRHRILWRRLTTIRGDAGLTGNVLDLTDALQAAGELEPAGGFDYVISIAQEVATTVGCGGWAHHLVDLARNRSIAAVLAQQAKALQKRAEQAQRGELDDPGAALREHMDALAAVGTVGQAAYVERLRVRSAVEAFVTRLKAACSGETRIDLFPWPNVEPELPKDAGAPIQRDDLMPDPCARSHTRPPWSKLSKHLGSLWPDRLTVLVGGTGKGKSAVAVQLAEGVARAGHPVLYASAEMGTDELVARLLALRAKGPHESIDRGRGVAWNGVLNGRATPDAVTDAGVALARECPRLYLWAPRTGERTAEEIQRVARAISAAHGGRAPFVVVDYVQRFAPSVDERRMAVAGLSGELRDLSRPGGLGPTWPGAAVLALSSTGRDNYGKLGSCDALAKAYYDHDPLEGLGKESGELEYDAPLVLCFTTDKPNSTTGTRRALFAFPKNRQGRSGIVGMYFSPACGRFREPHENEPNPAEPPKEDDDQKHRKHRKTKEPAIPTNDDGDAWEGEPMEPGP